MRKEPARRVPGKPFPKGKSGNPKGRPKLTLEEREFRELAKQHAPAALERMVKRAKGKGMTAQRADEYLCDAGYGKPRQSTDVGVSVRTGGLLIMLPPQSPEE